MGYFFWTIFLAEILYNIKYVSDAANVMHAGEMQSRTGTRCSVAGNAALAKSRARSPPVFFSQVRTFRWAAAR
jgi:hypothetical protein